MTLWEHLRLPHEVDGSAGAFRAPLSTRILGVDNDYEAIQAWLASARDYLSPLGVVGPTA